MPPFLISCRELQRTITIIVRCEYRLMVAELGYLVPTMTSLLSGSSSLNTFSTTYSIILVHNTYTSCITNCSYSCTTLLSHGLYTDSQYQISFCIKAHCQLVVSSGEVNYTAGQACCSFGSRINSLGNETPLEVRTSSVYSKYDLCTYIALYKKN